MKCVCMCVCVLYLGNDFQSIQSGHRGMTKDDLLRPMKALGIRFKVRSHFSLQVDAPFLPMDPDICPNGRCGYLANGSLISNFSSWIPCPTSGQKCRGGCANRVMRREARRNSLDHESKCYCIAA